MGEDRAEAPVDKVLVGAIALTMIMLPLSIVVGSFAGTSTFDIVRGATIGASSWVVGSSINLGKRIEITQTTPGKSPSYPLTIGITGAAIPAVVLLDESAVAWVLAPLIGIVGGWITTSAWLEIRSRYSRAGEK